MTINIADNSPRISYSVADGVTQTSFAVPFEFFDDEDLNVYVDGTLKTLTSDYTVAGGDGSTGTVTISVTGGSGGSTVVITRDIDLERTTDFPVSGAFNIVALNTELDRLVAIAADLEDLAGRGVKLADFDTQAALTLPLASERGNKVLAFNATGDTLISQELGTWQSDWAASTEYKERDLVRDSSDGSIYIVNSAHTSSGTTPLDTNTNSSKYDVIFDVGAMIAGTVTMTGDLTVQGNTTLGNASSDSITMTGTAANLRMSTTNVTDILDEDTMSSDSATALATQQSIKAYVDSQVGANDTLTEILSNGNTTGGTNLVVSSGDTLDVDGALDASGTISLGGNFPTGTDNVALGSSALGAVLSTGERNTIIGSAAGDGITNGDDNTALGAGALGSITTQSSNTAVGRNALTSTTGTANTALGNGAGSQITSGQYNTVIGLFNGNQNSLDIRTSSNNIVLSDGQGNVRFYANSSGNVGFGSVSPDAELHISSSSSTPKIIIENSINPRGNFIGVENNGDLVLGADEDSLSGSSSIKFKVDGTQVMSLDYQGTLALTGNATFGDNDNAIFGAGSDLRIYHDGSDSYIRDTGIGDLYLAGSNNIYLTDVSFNPIIRLEDTGTGGIVYLYNEGSVKLATTSTGVDITGTLTSDGLTVDGTSQFNTGAAGIAEFFHSSGYGGIKVIGSAAASSATVYLSNDKNGTPFDIYTIVADGADDSLQFWSGGNPSSGTKRFNAASNGDISFYEDTGTTAKFFWDASAESLGIGTTSPSSYNSAGDNLVIAETSGGAGLTLASSTTGSGHILFADGTTGTGAYDGFIRFDHTTSSMRFASGGGNERMRIDSSGNVGIGTSSPQRPLHVDGAEGVARFTSTASGNNGFEVGIGASSQAFLWQSENSYMQFATNATERMRIDSSGNLLVGATSATGISNGTNEGVLISSSQKQIAVGVASDVALYLNRQSTDGTIAEFRKDGTTVGSIGNNSSDLEIYAPNQSGIALKGNNVTPMYQSNQSDNQTDLGRSANRWRDLYLSGGVYLGGTGSANLLDDYEEGTWTPSFSGGFSSVTYSTQSGVYTKIGDLVVCKMRLTMSAFSGDSNFLTIQGLPFTVESVTAQTGGTAPMLDNLTATVNNITVQPTSGGSTFIFITGNGGTGSHSGLTGNQCTVNTDIRATIIYQTT